MSTDCCHDILQNYSVHYVHHCRPIITECKWYWYIFVLSMLCIECTYVLELFCITSSISTIPNSDGKIRVPFIHSVAQEDTFQGDWVTWRRWGFWGLRCLCVTSPIPKLHCHGKQIPHPGRWGISKGPASGAADGILTFECWLKIEWSEILKGCQIRLGTSEYHSNGAVARKATGWCFFDVSFWCTTVIIEIC